MPKYRVKICEETYGSVEVEAEDEQEAEELVQADMDAAGVRFWVGVRNQDGEVHFNVEEVPA
ncbi:hypothetical protein JW921_05900 [Candidatus Fermentibacterales bacterium]|nr:hypothetical protein [Candidatus Fermentibacterales bacterium]